ncbi:reverse transcriptase domain-containing protein [Xanthomonas arboricola]|uniref:reverse transcriptase domain-containing protein n=1 Tax=Xanthomonas arboricola TaxID=56448 RepID=UPI000E0F9992|nr:reverse transcriptase domain-containing protein [Xanthomonas arboricola]
MAPPDLSLQAASLLAVSNRAELAEWLGTTDKRLRYMLYGRGNIGLYKVFEVAKRSGGTRKIAAPKPFLKALQRRLAAVFPLISAARGISMAYTAGRGIIENAKVHRRKRWVVATDLEEFFPSINLGRIRGLFLSEPFNFPKEVATVLAQVCCYQGALPQGAPTSPALSNIICRSLDRKLVEFARRSGIAVTRYADDIVFSFNFKECPDSLVNKVDGRWIVSDILSEIIESSGFKVNHKKTRVTPRSQRQLVTGLVVNQRPAMPREWRRRNRVILRLLQTYGKERASQIISEWKGLRRPGADAEAIIRGATAFASNLDKNFNGTYTSSLRRNYPLLSQVISYSPDLVPVEVLTEGKTDRLLLEFAYAQLRLLPEFQDLRLKFSRLSDTAGDGALAKRLDELAARGVRTLTIGLFDADNDQYLSKYRIAAGEFSAVSKTSDYVYSGIIPKPTDDAPSRFCIEHYFPRDFISRTDEFERRLYFLDEFDKRNGRHKSLPLYKISEKSTLIVDDKVFSIMTDDDRNYAMTKADFAEKVVSRTPPYEDADVNWFSPVFKMLKNFSLRYS